MLKEQILKVIDAKTCSIKNEVEFKHALRLMGILPTFTSEFKAI